MATDAGQSVRVLLHPHTEALAALLMPGTGEARDEAVQHQRSKFGGPSCQQQQQQGLSQPPQHDGTMWVSPPALQSLREQTKQLQQQRRAKQRQHITMDSSPARYELPRGLQRPQQQGPAGDGARSYTLVGVSPQQQGTPSVSHRRERDGGVVVPLRMMSSLMITGGGLRPTSPRDGGGGGDAAADDAGVAAAAGGSTAAAGGAGAAVSGAAGGFPRQTPIAAPRQGPAALQANDASRPHSRQQTLQAEEARDLGLAVGPGASRDRSSAPEDEDNLDMDLGGLRCLDDAATVAPRSPGAHRQERAVPLLLGHSCHGLALVSAPGPGGAAPFATTTTSGRALSSCLSAEHAYVDMPARGPRESGLLRAQPSDPQQKGQQQAQAQRHLKEQAQQQMWKQRHQEREEEEMQRQQHQLPPATSVPSPGVVGLRSPGDAAVAPAEEDEADGAMLIDVGSGDRAAEGALLPTPERPRAAGSGPAAGWDALRGLSFRGEDEEDGCGRGGQRDGVFGTLTLLGALPAQASGENGGGGAGGELSRWQQPSSSPLQPMQEPTDMVLAEDLPGPPGRTGGAVHGGSAGAAVEVRGNPRLVERQSSPGQAAGAAAAGGADAGAGGEDGFEADDEGEDGAREERVRGASRLSARSFRWRPLPGLAASPPWSPTSPPATPLAVAPDPAQQRLGLLVSFSSLALARPRDTPPPHHPQPQTCSAAALSHLHSGAGQAVGEQSGAALGLATGRWRASVDGGAGADAAALEELLKLKCSLRRAVQGQNAQAMGLILTLLAGMAVTPQLLADSQVAALVSPLQSSSSADVAAAARRLAAGWKDVLKAAARRPSAAPASARGHPGAASAAAAVAAAGAAVAGMELDGGGGAHFHQQEWQQAAGPLRSPLTGRAGLRAGAGAVDDSLLQYGYHHHHHHNINNNNNNGRHPAHPHQHQARDVDERDQAANPRHAQPQPHPHPHPQPHQRASTAAAAHDLSRAAMSPSLARSQSDVLPEAMAAAAKAEALMAAAHPGAVPPDRRSRPGVQVPLQLAPLQPQPQSHPERDGFSRGGTRSLISGRREGEEDGAAAGAAAVQAPKPAPWVGGDHGAPSTSRTVSEADGGSGGEGTNDEAGGQRGRPGAPTAFAGAGAGSNGDRGLRLGGKGNGSGGGSGGRCCSDGSGPVAGPSKSYSPLPTPTAAAAAAAAAAAGGLAEGAGAMDRLLHNKRCCPRAPSGGGLGDVGGITLTPAHAHTHAPAADIGSPCIPLPMRDPSAGAGMGLAVASPGSVTTQPPPAALPLPPTAAGGSALLLPPGVLAQPPGGRKRKGERSSSRRRSGNPNKRPVSGVAMAGQRVLHAGSLPLPPLPDAAAGTASDDLRYPHPPLGGLGPLTGVKTPTRSSLLGLHPPLSKRQRHHAGGGAAVAAPAAHAGGGGCATQVRRVSLLLSSMDLGTAAGEREEGAEDERAAGELAGAAAAAAGPMTEGDADADMGSQDDGAAMATSDDDLIPAGPRSGGYGSGYGGAGAFAGWDDAGAAFIVIDGPSRGPSASPPALGPGQRLGVGLGVGFGGGSGAGGSSSTGIQGQHQADGVVAVGSGRDSGSARGDGSSGTGTGEGGPGWRPATVESGPVRPPALADAAG